MLMSTSADWDLSRNYVAKILRDGTSAAHDEGKMTDNLPSLLNDPERLSMQYDVGLDALVARLSTWEPTYRRAPVPWWGEKRLAGYTLSCALSDQAGAYKTKMHRPGIEPGPSRWQRPILPLNHRCFLCGVFKTYLQDQKIYYQKQN